MRLGSPGHISTGTYTAECHPRRDRSVSLVMEKVKCLGAILGCFGQVWQPVTSVAVATGKGWPWQ